MKPYFKQACYKIKSMGYRVFVSTRPGNNYGFISDGNGIGYFQLTWDGISFATYNKPGSGCSGYSVNANGESYLVDDIDERIVETTFCKYPAWVGRFEWKPVKKYESLDEFLQNYWDKKNLKEYESED